MLERQLSGREKRSGGKGWGFGPERVPCADMMPADAPGDGRGEAHLEQDPGMTGGVAKRIHLPADPRGVDVADLVPKKEVPQRVLVDDLHTQQVPSI